MGLKLSFAERTPLNLAVNIARIAIMALIGVLLVPFYIDKLGMAAYGIIPLATTISSYLMIMTDSLGVACTRYSVVAIHEKEDASGEISTSFFGIGRVCLLVLPIIIVLSYCTPWIFGIGDINADDVRIMFLLILSSALFVALATAFQSVFSASNTNYRFDGIRAIYLLIQVALILVLFFVKEPSLVYIGVAYFVSSLILLALMYVVAKRTYPPMKLRYGLYDSKLFKSIGNLGVWNIVDKIGSMLFFQISLVIVNIMLGTYYGGGFAIVSTFVSMFNTVCYSIMNTMSPHLYRSFTDGDRDRTVRIIATTMKFMAITVGIPVAFIIVFSKEILTIWVGSQYESLFNILSIAVLLNFTFAISTVLEDVPTINLKVNLLAGITVLFGIVNIIASIAAIALGFGVTGVVWACSLTTLVYGVARVYINERIVGTETFRFMRHQLFSLGIIAGCYILFCGIRMLDILGCRLIPLIIVFLVVFFVVEYIFVRMFSEEEKNMISEALPGPLKSVFVKLF